METGTAATGEKEHAIGGKRKGYGGALEKERHKKENTGEVIEMMCK